MARKYVTVYNRMVILVIVGCVVTILIYFHFVDIDYDIFTETKDMELSITIQQPKINTTNNYEILITNKPKLQTINKSQLNETNMNLQLIWKCLFYHYILYPKYISPINHINYECYHYKNDISSYNIQHFLQLTNSHINNIPKNINHRYYIKLRRYIILITNSLNITSNKILDNILQYLHNIHKITSKELNYSLSISEKKYFLIHIPKSGGTSVCETFNKLGFHTTNPETQNCNIRRTQSSFKSWDWGILPCYKYFNKAISKKDGNPLDLLAYERNMHGHGISNIPNLCDEFIYILPFRHPLKRIYSWIDQTISKPHRQPTDFIIKRIILPNNTTDNKIKKYIHKYIQNIQKIYYQNIVYDSPGICTMKVFDVINNKTGQHMIYTPLYNVTDLNGFFRSLYMNENKNINDIITKINLTAKYWDIGGCANGNNCYCNRGAGIYKLYWFSQNKYNKYGFKVAMNWSWSGQHIEAFNFDYMKGYITNIYTRIFGYNHTIDKKKITYDAFYAKNNEIDGSIDYFINSVNLIMGIDYILPFKSRFNHSMWKYLFDIIIINCIVIFK
eukprot:23829_1